MKTSASASRLLLLALGSVVAILTAVSVVVAVLRPAPPALWAYVDVLERYNLPTWFTAAVLIVASLVCLLNGLVASARSRWGTRLWIAAAAATAVASLCVATGLHTRIDGLARQVVGTNALTSDWLAPAVVVGVLIALPFALLARRVQGGRWLTVAVVVFGVGALAGELVARTLGEGGRALAAVLEGVQSAGAVLLLAVAVATLHVARSGADLHLASDIPADDPTGAPRDLAPVPGRRPFWAVLVAVTLALSAVSLVAALAMPDPSPKLAQWVGYLDVNSEGNLPTWWSVGLLVAAGAAHLAAGLAGTTAGARGSIGWLVTAAILAGMSLDDMTSIHERVGDLVRPEGATAAGAPEGNFSFFWVIPGAGVALLIAIAVGLLAVKLRGRPRQLLVIGLAVLFFFALGLESIQGALLANGGGGRTVEVLGYHLEELGENVGALLLLGAATSALALRRREDGLDVRYTGAGDTGPEDTPGPETATGSTTESTAETAALPLQGVPGPVDLADRPTDVIPVIAATPTTRA